MIGRKLNHVGRATLFIFLTQQLSMAAETERLAWHTDMNAAWKVTQREGRPLLVFVSHDHCVPCVKMKNGTFAERGVTAAIMASYVPLAVDGGGGSPLLKDLAIKSYPTTFLISPDAVVLDRIEGYVPPATLLARFAATKKYQPPAKLAQAQ